MIPSNMKITPMDNRRAPQENFPRQGQVTEVCREWLVHEDQALAYRLQNEEFANHLGNNRERNAMLRQDTPKAREEQLREDEEAARAQHELEMDLARQEAKDAAIAAQIARELDLKELEIQKKQEQQDKMLAKSLGDKEKLKVRQAKEMRQVEREAAYLGINSGLDNVSILSRKDKRKGSRSQHNESTGSASTEGDRSDLSDLSDFCMKPSSSMDEDQIRRLQEGQDEELARLLQEQDLKRRGDLLQEDQLVAIEAQDRELAKILQEQERAKAKKAKEKARQKALLKKQAHSREESRPHPSTQVTDLDDDSPMYETPKFVNRQRSASPMYASPEAVRGQRGSPEKEAPPLNYESHTPSRNLKPDRNRPMAYETHTLEEPKNPSQYTNIACAIDPTYRRRVQTGELGATGVPFAASSSPVPKASRRSPTKETPAKTPSPVPLQYDEEDEEYLPPPYMPIQGQRRVASLEKPKAPKKKPKDQSCKQQ